MNKQAQKKVKVFITGATGFVGSHLADYLIDEVGAEVHGLIRPRSRTEFVRPDVTYHEADITDYTGIASVVKQVKPNYVFHLAAQTFVPLSWTAPNTTLLTNVMGTLHILEAVKNEFPEATVQVAGSSEEYGLVYSEECPVKESQPLRPLSPYGISKVASDLLAQQYHRSYNLNTIITRAFNHTGPRRGKVFVTSKIANLLANIIVNHAKPIITLGNLEAVRDFSDVRDIVRAYWMIANTRKWGEVYNIGMGKGYSVEAIVNIYRQICGVEFTIEHDPAMMRPSDVPLLVCDATKMRGMTSWKPRYEIRQTLTDLLDYWIARLKAERQ